MKSQCKQLQKKLAQGGPTSLQEDVTAQQHLVDCHLCFAFMESLATVDTDLSRLQPIEPPEALIQKTLATVEAQAAPRPALAETKTRPPESPITEQDSTPTPPSPGLFGRLWQKSNSWENQRRYRYWMLLAASGALVGGAFFFVVGNIAEKSDPLSLDSFESRNRFAKIVVDGKKVDELVEGEDFEDITIDLLGKKDSQRHGSTRGLFGYGGGAGAIDKPSEPGPVAAGRVLGADGTAAARDEGRWERHETTTPDYADFDPELAEEIPFATATAEPGPEVAANGKPTALLPKPVMDPASTEVPLSGLDSPAQQMAGDHVAEIDLVAEAEKTTEQTRSGSTVASHRRGEKNPETPRSQENHRYKWDKDRISTRGSFETSKKELQQRAEELANEFGDEADGDGFVVPDGTEARDRGGELRGKSSGLADFKKTGRLGKKKKQPPQKATVTNSSIQAAQSFMTQRELTEELVYQQARGYWSNTYVPGDPDLRYLQMRLLGQDRSQLRQVHGAPLQLHDAARQTSQPFDPPRNSALAVYLNSEKTHVTQRSRMLVQVGLQGTQRHSGLRSAMNVGIVLDLRQIPTAETGAAMRAVVDAFAQSRQSGDRFSLTVAGRSGGLVVDAQEFRQPRLKAELQKLLTGQAQPDQARPDMDLQQALQQAMRVVGDSDNANAPLGSSAVIVISALPFGSELPALTQTAHSAAVAGKPTSVIGVGNAVALEELDRLTLAGQGNRRLLLKAADASALVQRELTAVNRVVARAVRLRIRLAPGVQLVDVLGSHRLDEAKSQQVRQAEQSIDQRMARNLGIQSDRGDDEEGIQIVIPTFYAGDSHVVTLDVVADQAGPIADVTVRYKDLVYMRNGVARANCSLGLAPMAVGTLELNVLKNYLAQQLSQKLRLASTQLSQNDQTSAQSLLQSYRGLLSGLQHLYPALAKDPDIARDIVMLAEYGALLRNEMPDQQQQYYLAESMQLASYLKVLPRPDIDN